MAHRKSGKTARSGLPTKEDILNFVAENPGRIGKREIARAFHVAPADRVALKGLLRTMAEEGLLEKSGRRLQRPGMLPKVAVLSVTGRDNDGELVARPADWDELEAGPAPKIILRQARRTAEPSLMAKGIFAGAARESEAIAAAAGADGSGGVNPA